MVLKKLLNISLKNSMSQSKYKQFKDIYYLLYSIMMPIILFFYLISNCLCEKFCVNCKYFIKNPFSKNNYGRCAIFTKENEYTKIDYLITGKRKIEYKFCSSAREDEKMCGINGKYFIEKENCFKRFKL